MDKQLEWIPEQWSGLFCILSSTEPSVSALEDWWKDTTSSHYAEPLSWTKLCSALLSKEPHINKNQLVFVPRLLSLPLQQQQFLMSFLDQHKNSLAGETIDLLCDCLQSVDDFWIRLLVKNMKGENCSIDYTVSKRNKSRYDELVAFLKQNSNDDQAQQYSMWGGLADTNAKTDSEGPEASVLDSQPIAIDVDTPEGKFFFGSSQSPQGSQFSSTQRSLKRKLQLDVETPLSDKMLSQPSADVSLCDISSSQMVDSNEIEKIRSQLVDYWEGREEMSEDFKDLLTKVTISQMDKLCQSFGSLSESGLAAACKHMCGVSSQLPHSHAVSFAQNALQPKLSELNQTCSRSLLHSFLTFSKTFGRPVIEGVLVPALKDESLCVSKADLVNRVVKESLEATLKEELLKQLAEQCVKVCEPVIPVIQTLVDSKLTLQEQCMTSFLKCLEKNSAEFQSNLKFGKLILAVINKYPKQLLPCHHQSLHAIAMIHSTFLKKSLATALSKLQ